MFIRKKKIVGRTQFYLEHSFRLPDGRIKKISKYIPTIEKGIIKKHELFFQKAEEDVLINFARKYYTKDNIFNENSIEKLERIRLDYKKLIKKLTKTQFQDILDRFTVNFTYESNAIEGNSLTLKDVAIIIHENVSIKGKNLREIYETINARKAVDLIFKKKFRITEKSIIELHSILVRNTGVKTGYKTLPNFLLTRKTRTTPPEKVAEEMGKLIDWYNSEKNIHPLKKAAIFHGRFEKIHPFEDGNGRVGRMLINIMLINSGYPPLIIRKTQRIAYFSALEASDSGHFEKLEWFLVEKFKDTYRNFFEVYIKYLK